MIYFLIGIDPRGTTQRIFLLIDNERVNVSALVSRVFDSRPKGYEVIACGKHVHPSGKNGIAPALVTFFVILNFLETYQLAVTLIR